MRGLVVLMMMSFICSCRNKKEELRLYIHLGVTGLPGAQDADAGPAAASWAPCRPVTPRRPAPTQGQARFQKGPCSHNVSLTRF